MSRFVRSLFVGVAVVFASACSVNLQHDLNEDDANDIYVLLQKNNVDATKIKEGEGKDARYVISVPKAFVSKSAELLRQNSLPRPKSDGLAIFKMTKGMIPTQTEERAMFIEALGGEVSNALNRLPGVLEARTIVMIPEVNDLTQPEKKPQPSASVLIKYFLVDDKVPVTVPDIQAFVANAVPELKAENVKVLLAESKMASAGGTGEDDYQHVLGVKVATTSAATFKTIIGLFALLFIAMAGVTAFMVVRKPASAKPAPRAKTQEG